MATIIEITIPRLTSTGWWRSSKMQGAPILKESVDPMRMVSSSYLGNAMMTTGLSERLLPSFIQSGSFLGTPATAGIFDVTVSNSSATMLSGSFGVTPQSHDIYVIADEDHNKSRMTSDNPMANQSVSNVQWNFFPIPEVVPEPPLGKDRDLTRYQKAYSFSRHQPVKIRVIRR